MTANEVLEIKVEKLTQQIDRLNELLASDLAHWPVSWRLTPQETRALWSLYTSPNGFRSDETLSHVVKDWGVTAKRRKNETREQERALVYVVISHINKKLTGRNVRICRHYGCGFELSPADRMLLKKALDGMKL